MISFAQKKSMKLKDSGISNAEKQIDIEISRALNKKLRETGTIEVDELVSTCQPLFYGDM